jgi:hypothetical protein
MGLVGSRLLAVPLLSKGYQKLRVNPISGCVALVEIHDVHCVRVSSLLQEVADEYVADTLIIPWVQPEHLGTVGDRFLTSPDLP